MRLAENLSQLPRHEPSLPDDLKYGYIKFSLNRSRRLSVGEKPFSFGGESPNVPISVLGRNLSQYNGIGTFFRVKLGLAGSIGTILVPIL